MPYVQFSDSTQTKVITVFSCPQDEEAYPNQAEIEDTDARYLAFINPSTLPRDAQAALDKSDVTMLRCFVADVAVPSAWIIYRSALRAIVNGTDTTSTTLPATPAFPVGT